MPLGAVHTNERLARSDSRASETLAVQQSMSASTKHQSPGAPSISVIGAPGETLVDETSVSASSPAKDFRNFRKRYANQDGGRAVSADSGSSAGHGDAPQRGSAANVSDIEWEV